MENKQGKKVYAQPEIIQVQLDRQISLAMTSPGSPPSDPVFSVKTEKFSSVEKA